MRPKQCPRMLNCRAARIAMSMATRFHAVCGGRFLSKRLLRLTLRLILRIEGGEMLSQTARELMRQVDGVEIGSYSYGVFQMGVYPAGSTIGRYCSISRGARFFRRNHPIDAASTHPLFFNECLGVVEPFSGFQYNPLHIGDDAWIGYGALILPGCTRIGTGAIVGAGAVVTKDVPDYTIVAGNPARVVRHRVDGSIAARLQMTRWYERDVEELDSVTDRLGARVSDDLLVKLEEIASASQLHA